MVAETARKFEALERQAHIIMARYAAAGYEAVAPAMIQPADVFLDVIGEQLRARTYVFTDPDGAELCLRPDLTVPTCRLHLARSGDPARTARYCYNGATFRFQPVGADAAHPREFRQAGIELFGAGPAEQREAEIVALVVGALKAAGLKSWKIRIGDLGLFNALLGKVEMPERWRDRLKHEFWRRDAVRGELRRLARDPAQALTGIDAALVAALGAAAPEAGEMLLAAHLEQRGLDVVGTRSLGEIADRLRSLAADAGAEPLNAGTAALIEGYLDLVAPARQTDRRLRDLLAPHGLSLGPMLESFDRRLALLENAGIDTSDIEFRAEFGRNLEYYTGFVFEVDVPGLGAASPVAGGGRYDHLLRAVGAPADVPAVGAAIHTERLLAALSGDVA